MSDLQELIDKRFYFGFRDSWNLLTPQLFTGFKLYNEKDPEDKREANIILQKQLKYCWDLYFNLKNSDNSEYQKYAKFVRACIDQINAEVNKL